MKNNKVKLITETNSFIGTTGRVTRFVELNDKKFKITYLCSNGTDNLNVDVMIQDGSFQPVLHRGSIGQNFEFVSYVAYQREKEANAKVGIALAEKMLEKLY